MHGLVGCMLRIDHVTAQTPRFQTIQILFPRMCKLSATCKTNFYVAARVVLPSGLASMCCLLPIAASPPDHAAQPNPTNSAAQSETETETSCGTRCGKSPYRMLCKPRPNLRPSSPPNLCTMSDQLRDHIFLAPRPTPGDMCVAPQPHLPTNPASVITVHDCDG